MDKKIYIIDGSSYIYRAFYAIRGLANSKGMPTNAVYGFITMLLKVLKDEKPQYLVVAADARGPSFREKLYKEYKANRPAMPDELQPQIPYIKKVIDAFNIRSVEKSGYEADDIIGTLARQYEAKGFKVVIITGDKDMMQLVSDNVTLWDTMKDKKTGMAEVKDRFGVGPDNVPDAFALMGDSSDNIPGVPGIGEKTAIELLKEFHSLDNLLKNVAKVKKEKLRENIAKFADQARLSRQLATIDCAVKLDIHLEDLAVKSYDTEKLRELFSELEFSKFLKDLTPQKTISYDNYHTVSAEPDFNKLMDRLTRADEFAIDTETDSKNPVSAGIVGISISLKEHEAYYIPLRHKEGSKQLPAELVLGRFKELLTGKSLKIGQNIKYDMIVFRQAGLAINPPLADTMIAAYLLNPNKRNHSLEEIAREYLGHQMITYKDMIGTGQKEITFDKVDIAKATTYSAEDADATYLLSKILLPKLKSEGLYELYQKIEMPLVPVLADMEITGVRVDADYLKELSNEFAGKIDKIKRAAFELAGTEFNLDSPKQLQEVLFEKLQLPKTKRIKTGFSTDSDELAKLAQQHDLPAKILEHRTLAKLKNTYIDGLLEMINNKTGRLHTSYNQTITATGRLSSSEPNLQNIPVRTEEGRRIRQAFIPAKGCVLVSADYSQIEPRILAHFSNDKLLVSSFENNQDIHTRTAAELLNISEDMVSADERRMAKTINFGIIYGMSAHGLASALGISHNLAQTYIDEYFVKYSGVKAYMEGTLESARAKGYVETLMGRKRPCPEINSANVTVRNFAERAAINAPLQGSAADIMKLAMIKIHNRLSKSPLERGRGVLEGTRMIMQVHDELVFEVPLKEEAELIKLIRQEMETVVELNVPLRVDISKGNNWTDMKKVK